MGEESLVELFGGAPIVYILTQQIKQTFGVDGRYVWLLAMVVGIVAQAVYGFATAGADWAHFLIYGVINGLSASGLYSGMKTGPGKVGAGPPATGPDFND